MNTQDVGAVVHHRRAAAGGVQASVEVFGAPRASLRRVIMPLSLLLLAHGYKYREDAKNPVLKVIVGEKGSFASADAAFFSSVNSSSTGALWLASASRKGDARARSLLAVLLKYCDTFLSEAAVAKICAELKGTSKGKCTCQSLAKRQLQLAHKAGDKEATQALAAQYWTLGSPGATRSHVRLQAAASAAHDGSYPNERPPTPLAELPAAALPSTGESAKEKARCASAAELLLPLAASVDDAAGPKAATVAVSLRRLALRWNGRDPKDETLTEHLAAAEEGLAWAVRSSWPVHRTTLDPPSCHLLSTFGLVCVPRTGAYPRLLRADRRPRR